MSQDGYSIRVRDVRGKVPKILIEQGNMAELMVLEYFGGSLKLCFCHTDINPTILAMAFCPHYG